MSDCLFVQGNRGTSNVNVEELLNQLTGANTYAKTLEATITELKDDKEIMFHNLKRGMEVGAGAAKNEIEDLKACLNAQKKETLAGLEARQVRAVTAVAQSFEVAFGSSMSEHRLHVGSVSFGELSDVGDAREHLHSCTVIHAVVTDEVLYRAPCGAGASE